MKIQIDDEKWAGGGKVKRERKMQSGEWRPAINGISGEKAQKAQNKRNFDMASRQDDRFEAGFSGRHFAGRKHGQRNGAPLVADGSEWLTWFERLSAAINGNGREKTPAAARLWRGTQDGAPTEKGLRPYIPNKVAKDWGGGAVADFGVGVWTARPVFYIAKYVKGNNTTMIGSLKRLDARSRPFRMVFSLALVALVGMLDFRTGFELNFFAFYLIPVSLAVWFVGRGFGILVSACCVVVSIAGDVVAGARYSSSLVPVWNTSIAFIFYLVVVWILSKLRALHNELEERVRQRTAALNLEMQERMRLEEEILSISEREQQRIGHDLHDSLCQHLTGVALAGEVLNEQLAAKSLPEAKAMSHIVELIEGAIELTRTLARGLHPFELTGEGFTDALRELAATITEGFKTPCAFECDEPVEIADPDVAIHLYRIAQEAITNAVKHSNAKMIVVRLSAEADGLTLTIRDDGVGMPPKLPGGMGLRTMAYRASVIGASFSVERLVASGTRVTCKLPRAGLAPQSHVAKN